MWLFGKKDDVSLTTSWASIYNDMLMHFRDGSTQEILKKSVYASAFNNSMKRFINSPTAIVIKDDRQTAFFTVDKTVQTNTQTDCCWAFQDAAVPNDVIWLGCSILAVGCAQEPVPDVLFIDVPTEPLHHRRGTRVFERIPQFRQEASYWLSCFSKANDCPNASEIAFLTLLNQSSDGSDYPDVALQKLVTKMPNIQPQSTCLHMINGSEYCEILAIEGFEVINRWPKGSRYAIGDSTTVAAIRRHFTDIITATKRQADDWQVCVRPLDPTQSPIPIELRIRLYGIACQT